MSADKVAYKYFNHQKNIPKNDNSLRHYDKITYRYEADFKFGEAIRLKYISFALFYIMP